ncbi:hypothetical protein RclHR1_02730001 [Rhizophagus clarus]|uniref:Uncharacterized protein n=1 Tax=Rhizophagus clarus TaxID=94130 RepID=A0A2Z6RFM4_9GLOM|nr:hypothetical protein RclHR1_02730001 [Rhizophagus clarus]GES81126.1 hypothetical protein GLOIN_2v1785920 [Rhizophagus clarus]
MERIPLVLESDDKEIILVTHDECIFYSNDRKRGVWTKSGELLLRKKGNGRSTMVSEFLLEKCGQLKLNSQQIQENLSISQQACIYLQLGKNQDGSNHTAFKSNTLVASRMNLKPGGKQSKMKGINFGPNNQYQSMINDDGKPKGMKQILIERGLWRNSLSADCKLCKDKILDITQTDCCAHRIISL